MCHQINLGEEHQIKSVLCLSLVLCTDKILSALLAAYPATPRSPPPAMDERAHRRAAGGGEQEGEAKVSYARGEVSVEEDDG
jgi:hypothetical protein